MKIAFISGHGTLNFEDFIEHYIPFIDEALTKGYGFIIGDFNGCDTLAQEYLKDKTSSVTICHCFKNPRYKVNKYGLKSNDWKYIGGFNTDDERDSYMTKNSDYDIAISFKENSGTEKNIKRRIIWET
jgi:hypothetical protein